MAGSHLRDADGQWKQFERTSVEGGRTPTVEAHDKECLFPPRTWRVLYSYGILALIPGSG